MPVNSRCNAENNKSVPQLWGVVSGVVPTSAVARLAMRLSRDTRLPMRRLRARRRLHPLQRLGRCISRQAV